jgi:hypothetical protein
MNDKTPKCFLLLFPASRGFEIYIWIAWFGPYLKLTDKIVWYGTFIFYDLLNYDLKFVQHINMLREEAKIIFRYISLSCGSLQNGFLYTGMKSVWALNLHPSDLKTKQLKLNYSPSALKRQRWLKITVCEASGYGEICLLL